MRKKRRLERELLRVQDRLNTLFEHSPDMIYLLDLAGRVFEINSAAEPLLGYSEEELFERSYVDLIAASERAEAERRFSRILDGGVERFETLLLSRDGDELEFEILATPVVENGRVVGVFGSARHIADRTRMERELRTSELRFRALFEDNIDAVVTFDPDGRFIAANRATEEMMGYREAELIGTSFLPYIVPELQESTQEQFARVREGSPVRYETAMFDRAGEVVDLHITVIPIVSEGQLLGIHCIGKDVTTQKRLERALEEMAYHDYLTGLPNQRAMHRHLEQMLAADVPFAVMMIDLDRFKSINDSWGHEVGDLLLQAVAERLQTDAPEGTMLFRYGGDELVAVTRVGHANDASAVAEQLLGRFGEPFRLREHEVAMTASIGVAEAPADGDEIDVLFTRADNAMYHAKAHGRNTFSRYQSIVRGDDVQLLQLELELRSALRRDEISVVFQPQVELTTGRVHGVEALMRWTSEHLGEIAPLDFIPIAENSGLIVELGTWVLEKACAQLARWRAHGREDLHVCVNISVHQFYHPEFETTLIRLFREYAIDPGSLVLEVTESVASRETEVIAQLERVKRLGVRIALDDFGTGYSSLRYLREYPIDYLKIDRSFLEDLESSEADRNMLRTIIGLSKSLGLTTIAEGVERETQVEFLRAHGAEVVQGFYCSEPLSDEEFDQWMRHLPAGELQVS